MARFDSSNVDAKSAQASGGSTAEKPGKYKTKVAVIKDMSEQASPHMLLTLHVTGTGPGRDPIGSVMFHRIYFTEKTMEQAAKFYLRMGLAIVNDNNQVVGLDGDTALDTDALSLLYDKEICGDWSVEKSVDDRGNERRQLRCAFSEFWLATDEHVAGWDCVTGKGATSGGNGGKRTAPGRGGNAPVGDDDPV